MKASEKLMPENLNEALDMIGKRLQGDMLSAEFHNFFKVVKKEELVTRRDTYGYNHTKLLEVSFPRFIGKEERLNITQLMLVLSYFDNNGSYAFDRHILDLKNWDHERTEVEKTYLIYLIRYLINQKRHENRVNSEQKYSNLEKECYHYIGANPEKFSKELGRILKKHPEITSFFDVGCGIGEKPLLAYFLFNQIKMAGGLELTRHTYELAKKNAFRFFSDLRFETTEDSVLFKDEEWYVFNLFRENAFNFEGLSNWDLIYTYNPIPNSTMIKKLYEYILINMKEGAFLYEIGTLEYIYEVLRKLNRGNYQVKYKVRGLNKYTGYPVYFRKVNKTTLEVLPVRD